MSRAEQLRSFHSGEQKTEAAQDVVFKWLKQHILTLPRHDGVFLTEAEVSRATGTSRTPVREAMLRLEADGLLQIVPKKGAYVPPVTDADIVAVIQARALVEDWCVRRATRFGDALAAELDRLIEEQAKHQDDPIVFIEGDRQFHRAIVGAAANPLLAGFYESLRDRQLRMGVHVITTSGQRIGEVLAEHRAIAASLRSGDPEAAAAAVAQHLATTLAALHMPPTAPWGRSSFS